MYANIRVRRFQFTVSTSGLWHPSSLKSSPSVSLSVSSTYVSVILIAYLPRTHGKAFESMADPPICADMPRVPNTSPQWPRVKRTHYRKRKKTRTRTHTYTNSMAFTYMRHGRHIRSAPRGRRPSSKYRGTAVIHLRDPMVQARGPPIHVNIIRSSHCHKSKTLALSAW